MLTHTIVHRHRRKTWSRRVAVTERTPHDEEPAASRSVGRSAGGNRSRPLVVRSRAQKERFGPAGSPRVRKTIVRGPRSIGTHAERDETGGENSCRFRTAGVAFRDRLADCRPPDVATRPLPMTHATLVGSRLDWSFRNPHPEPHGHRSGPPLLLASREVLNHLWPTRSSAGASPPHPRRPGLTTGRTVCLAFAEIAIWYVACQDP